MLFYDQLDAEQHKAIMDMAIFFGTSRNNPVQSHRCALKTAFDYALLRLDGAERLPESLRDLYGRTVAEFEILDAPGRLFASCDAMLALAIVLKDLKPLPGPGLVLHAVKPFFPTMEWAFLPLLQQMNLAHDAWGGTFISPGDESTEACAQRWLTADDWMARCGVESLVEKIYERERPAINLASPLFTLHLTRSLVDSGYSALCSHLHHYPFDLSPDTESLRLPRDFGAWFHTDLCRGVGSGEILLVEEAGTIINEYRFLNVTREAVGNLLASHKITTAVMESTSTNNPEASMSARARRAPI